MELKKKRYSNMTLYLTLNCNLRCKYCFCGEKYTENMSEGMLEDAMAFFNGICTENATITFFGGEPLMRMDLIRRAITLNKEVYGGKFGFTITTNGLLLTPANYKFLLENRVDVLLSLDGNKESQDVNRPQVNGKGSWDVIMHNIEESDIKLPLRVTISKETLSRMADNVISLYESGFKSIAFYPASGTLWEENDFAEFDRQIKRLCDYIQKCYQNGIEFNNHWIDKSIKWHITNGAQSSCNPGVYQFSVTPSGDLYPCNHTNFEDRLFNIGNIKTGIVEERVAWIQNELSKKDEECSGCVFENRCKYCNINMFEETGFLWKVPEWYCRMNQSVIRHADAMAGELYKQMNKLFMKKFYNKEVAAE
ncbi:MAG: radical SAM protein [Lachnospiraceae bacterium]|nr:radical SAM protein [Lachnospiraceae bacterium]